MEDLTNVINVGNNVIICQILDCHILALKPNMEVFIKVWNLSFKLPSPQMSLKDNPAQGFDSPMNNI